MESQQEQRTKVAREIGRDIWFEKNQRATLSVGKLSMDHCSLIEQAADVLGMLNQSYATAVAYRNPAQALIAILLARLTHIPIFLIDEQLESHKLTKALEERGIANLIRFAEASDNVAQTNYTRLDLPKPHELNPKPAKQGAISHLYLNQESQHIEARPPQDLTNLDKALRLLIKLQPLTPGQSVIIEDGINPIETALFCCWALVQGAHVKVCACSQGSLGLGDGEDVCSAIAVITDSCLQALPESGAQREAFAQFKQVICLSQQLTNPVISLFRDDERFNDALVITSPRSLLGNFVYWRFNGDSDAPCYGRAADESQALILSPHLEAVKQNKPGVLWLSSPDLSPDHSSVVNLRGKPISSTGVEVIQYSDDLFVPIADDEGADQPRTEARNDTESKLLEILNKHLDDSIGGVSDTFIASATEAKVLRPILSEINRTFSLTLTKATVLKYDSVAKLASLAARSHAKLHNMVIKLNKAKGKPPLFFVCGIALYGTLAKNLVQDFSCYGIYIPEEDSFIKGDPNDAHGISLVELATKYVEAIKDHTSKGPYCLAGSSFGGVVAFEVARQLKSNGDEVTGLVLLDTMLPGVLIRTWRSCFRSLAKPLKQKFQAIVCRWPVKDKNGKTQQMDIINERRNQLQATLRGQRIKQYFQTMPKYDGQALVVRAQDQGGFHVPDDLCWGPMLGGKIHTTAAPGGHLEILQAPETAAAIAALKSR